MRAPRDHHGHIVHDLPVAPLGPQDAVVQGVRAGFGGLSLGVGVALRALEESATAPPPSGSRVPVSDVADLLAGTAWAVARLSGRLAAAGARITAPVLGLVLRPPLVPLRLQPAYGVNLVVTRWRRDRPETLRTLGRVSAAALPGVVDAALGQVDVDEVATVVLDRLDLDVLVAEIVGRLDVEMATLAVLARVDLTRIASTAIESTDLARVIEDALGRVDLDALLTSALGRINLTSVVTEQVDLGGVVAAALEHVDLTQIVMQQVDLIGVAEYVVDGIDLPEIIRDSTGSVASEAVVGLRMQGVDADLVLGRVVDRMLHRRRERRAEQGPQPVGSPSSDAERPTGKPV